MSGPSKVIVLDPDPRAGRQVQLGFEREGIPTVAPTLPTDPQQLELPPDAGLVMIGGSNGKGLDWVRRTRELLTAAQADIPIIVTGRGVQRGELEAAGADEVVVSPVFLRDVVILGRILRGTPAEHRSRIVGSLAETTGVYNLIRALCALGRSAVLTLIRGLRRGEVRLYRGEVTSAQVGLIHGQAALHQLLLWTDARFDFCHEDVVRRQQIPLSPNELFADAERFLEGVRESAGPLSPATVLEPDVQRVQDLGKQIPTEVHGVLRMFDGHRVLADILEDSPYRVFETLRVALKAVEAGLLKPVDSQRPKATWKAVLAIDEWLVGSETREAVVERTSSIDSSPVSSPKRKGKGGKRRAKKPSGPAPERQTGIDWGALVPRTIGGEVGQLAQVVPAMAAHGEMELKSRDVQREKLEAMMDTGKRDRIFPTDIGLEPKIIVDGGDDRESDEWTKAVDDAKVAAVASDTADESKRRRKKRDEDSAAVPGKRGAKRTPAAGLATAATPATGIPANAITPPAGVPLQAEAPKRSRRTPAAGVPITKEPSKRMRRTPAAGVNAIIDPPTGIAIPALPAVDPPVQAEADTDQDEAREWAEVERRAKERADEEAKAEAEAKAKTEADERVAEQAKAKAEAEAKAKADSDATEAKAKTDAEAKLKAEERAAAEDKAQADAAAKLVLDVNAQIAAAAATNAAKVTDKPAEAVSPAPDPTDGPQHDTPITLAAAAARAKAELDAKAEARRIDAQARAQSATAALRAIVEAETKASAQRAEAEARARRDAEAKATAEREAAEREAAEATAAAEKARILEAAERTKLERRAREQAAAKIDDSTRTASAADDAKAYAARVKAAAEAKRASGEHPALPASAETAPQPAAPKRPSLDAEGLVKQLVSEAIPPTVGPRRTPPSGIPAPSNPATSGSITAPIPRIEEADGAETTPFLRPDVDSTIEHSGPAITVSEAASSTVQVSDLLTVQSTAAADTATITASPRVVITESPVIQAGHATPLLLVHPPIAEAPAASAPIVIVNPPSAAPIATEDEPSDGIIRSTAGPTESDRLARLRQVRPPNPPEHDGPAIKETTGEIRQSAPHETKNNDTASEPSILIADQPTTLVSDLANVHAAVAAVIVHKPVTPTSDAATSSKELEVADVRRDAVAFTADEEAFFKSAESHTHAVPKIESFDDLDEGYEPPPSFWSRVFGKKPKT